MGSAAMACSGMPNWETITVRGSYAAPPGPDWSWRIDLTSMPDAIRVVMYNVYPAEQGGKEVLAVEATYSRASC